MTVQIQLRRGTAANWTSANPTLASGELGLETDTGKIKMGDGTTVWTSLGYFGGAPSGSAGGDLSGTYPNPSVSDNSHAHDSTTVTTHSTTHAHSATTGQTANDHHNRDHQSTHLNGGADVLALVHTINFIIDGGGAVITTGIKGDLKIDFACTVTEWTIISDVSGSIVVDIWKDTYANYPPVVGDSMTTSEKPTLSSVSKNQDTSLNSGAGWAIAAGSILRFNVDSVATVTRVTVALKVTRT